MKFPINISKGIRDAGKTTPMEKFSFGMFIAGIVNFLLFGSLQPLFVGIGIPSFVLILLQLGLTISVGVFILRHFVIREDDKFIEHQNEKDSSLNNYFLIRDKDNQEYIDSIPVYQYTDGSYMFLIRFCFGAATDRKASGSATILNNLYRNVLKYDMEIRTYNMPEVFRESIECKNFLNSISGVEYKPLSSALLEIAKMTLDICDEHSELFDITCLVRTRNPLQVEYIGTLVSKLLRDYSSRTNSFRSIDFLGKDKMRSFLRDYYCLEALDLASLKVSNIPKEVLLKYRNLVTVFELNLKDGSMKKKGKINLPVGGREISDKVYNSWRSNSN